MFLFHTVKFQGKLHGALFPAQQLDINISCFDIRLISLQCMNVQCSLYFNVHILYENMHLPVRNFRGLKELGCFHIIFAQILTAHNFCLTRITASILIYANALGYFLSIKVEFVMRNMISIWLCCCIWEEGSKKCNFQKIEEDK